MVLGRLSIFISPQLFPGQKSPLHYFRPQLLVVNCTVYIHKEAQLGGLLIMLGSNED